LSASIDLDAGQLRLQIRYRVENPLRVLDADLKKGNATLKLTKEHRMQAKTIVFRILAPALLLGAVNQVCAQPNFSGEWKMNPTRSNFAPLPLPDKLVRKISQHDSHLKIKTTQFGQQREIVTDLAYTTDGAVCKNVIRGEAFTGTARWDGDTLVIQSKREVQGMEIIQRESWTLSTDGQTLTIGNHIQTPQGAFDITIVLEKQLSS
jgi:hypothetical protein